MQCYRHHAGNVMQHYQPSHTPVSHPPDTDVVLSDTFKTMNMVPYTHPSYPHPAQQQMKKDEGTLCATLQLYIYNLLETLFGTFIARTFQFATLMIYIILICCCLYGGRGRGKVFFHIGKIVFDVSVEFSSISSLK